MHKSLSLALLIAGCGSTSPDDNSASPLYDTAVPDATPLPDASIDASVTHNYTGRVHALAFLADNSDPFLVTYDFGSNSFSRFTTKNGSILEAAAGKKYNGSVALSPDGCYLLTTQRAAEFNSEEKREVHLTNLLTDEDSIVYFDSGIPYFAWATDQTFFASRSEVGEQGEQITIYKHQLDGESHPFVTVPVSDYRMPLAIKRHWLAFRCPKEPTNPQSPSEICSIDILHGFQDQYARVTDSESDGFEFGNYWMGWGQGRSLEDYVLVPCRSLQKEKYSICKVNYFTNQAISPLIVQDDVDLSYLVFGPYPYALLSSWSVYNLNESSHDYGVFPGSFELEGTTISPELIFFAWEQ